MTTTTTAPAPSTKLLEDLERYVNLCSDTLGARVLHCSDEWFAEASNLVKPGRGDLVPGFGDTGKLYDGWETRRKRVPGHDWCLIKLGAPGTLHAVDIDTNHFTGNYPEYASIEGAFVDDETEFDKDADYLNGKLKWTTVLKAQRIRGHSQNIFEIHQEELPAVYNVIRFNIYPDGGVSRLKLYGTVHCAPNPAPFYKDATTDASKSDLIDYAFVKNGGRAVRCSDEHYGSKHNILMPNRGINMGDGWETRRRRGPGHDWCIVQLGAPCTVHEIVIDTAHFKGNYPHECSVEGTYIDNVERDGDALVHVMTDCAWKPLLAPSRMQAHEIHTFPVQSQEVVNYVRLNIHPDGGVSRFRVLGRKARN